MNLRRLKALPTFALLAIALLAFSQPAYAQPAASSNYLTRTGALGTTYSWIDCSAGTEIVTGDDAQASFNWPFNFRFYDNTYSPVNSLSVCTNGFIRLDALANTTYTAATNYALTATATELGQIIAAGVYDDEISPAGSGWVKFLVTGTAPYRILTIEYNNLEIDYNDNRYADVQVSLYESTNTVLLKFGTESISVNGVDMGIHSGVSGYFNKWQEVRSGTNNSWIEYAMPALPPAASWDYSTQTGTLGSLYNWIDCSAGTNVVTGDDAQGSFNWPFNFSFYDNNYNTSNSLSVSSNGFIRLDGVATTNYTAATDYDLTTSATSLGQIIATSVYDGYVGRISGSWCRRLVTGTAPYRVLTVEFNNYEIDYDDALYADVQVSFYETLNEVVVKYGNDNISATGVDMGIHSGVSGYYHKWQEALTGTNNSWIRYTRPIEVNASSGTGIAFYTTLKAAFDNINNGNHRGNITVKINGSTVETATATLNASGSGSALYTSVQVYPTFTGLSITANLAAPLIDLNGADNIVIDGRVNAAGTTPDLIIGNASVSSIAGTSTLRFINDASNNTVRYCVIKGSETVASSGVVFFSTTSLTSGNDNNTLGNNLITATSANSRPVNVVYSAGTAGKENSDNAITNNKIVDFLRQGSASNGINLAAYSTTWSITGNSLYETGSLAPTASVNYTAIRINSPTGIAFNISNNFIGGTGAQCSGTPFTKTNTANNAFHAISLNAGTAAASSIQNNSIRNFNWSNSGNAGFTGIEVLGGNANIGNLAGNIIGVPTGTGSIVVTNNTDGVAFYGIELAGNDTLDCKNNTIGAISAYNSNTSFRSDIIAINVNNTGSCIVQHNILGSETTPNSLLTGSPSTAAAQSVTGIMKNASGSLLAEYNIIANLTNANTGNAVGQPASVSGIVIAGSGQITLSGNSLYNLTNSYPTFVGSIIGIYTGSTYTSDENWVNGNFIFNLDATGGSLTNATVCGIMINNGHTVAFNNIISITNNTPVTAYGIHETGSSVSTSKLYFNTVYLGGTLPAGTVNKSYALYSSVTSNTRDFRNNILINARSTNAGSSLHYALYIAGTGGTLTVDHNNYYTPGTGGIPGYYGVDIITLPIVAGQDGGSLAVDPMFAIVGGSDPLDYYSATGLPGVTGTGITHDFRGLTRNSTPKMGALENNRFYWKGTLSSNFGTSGNWLDDMVPPDGSDISFDPAPVNHCLLDQNRVLNNITIWQSTYMLVLNGHTLTVTGNLELTNGARLDATSPQSLIVFSGLAQQNLPPSAFYNNTVNALEAANTEGLVLNGNLIIASGLTLTAGTFHLGANTLTLLSTTQGTALISGLGTGTIQGNITMQRYIPEAFGYRYISSPFQAATVNELADDANLQASFPTLYRYEENRDTAWWFDYTATAGLLKPMAGYALNLGTTATAATIDMTGEVSSGPMSVILGNHNRSITQGFNLVGNPYPSPIDWDAEEGWTRTNVDNAIYYFNPGTTNQYVGSYSTYINGVSSDEVAGNIIPAMQGFFVHVTDGTYPVTGSLGFSNSIRVNSLNPVFHKKTSLLSNGIALVRLAATYQGIGAFADPVVLLLSPEGHDSGLTGQADQSTGTSGQTDQPTGTSGQTNMTESPSATINPQYDAIKLLNTDPYAVSFYALSNHSRYAIKTWSLSANTDQPTIIPLGISLVTPGIIEFTLLRSQLYELYPGCRLYFHDQQTRAIINLEETTHTIFLEKGTCHNRFSLLLSYSELETSRGSSTELNAFCHNGSIAVYLDLPAQEKGTLHIADITGRILHSGTYTGIGYHNIAMNTPPGIYIVTLRSASGVASRKIFVP